MRVRAKAWARVRKLYLFDRKGAAMSEGGLGQG